MLEFLAKKDKYWREVALFHCKDKNLADDIVQEMYLRFHRNYKKDTVYTHYVIMVIRSIYFNMRKAKDNYIYMDDASLDWYHTNNIELFEPNDDQQKLLDACDEIKWYQKEILEESYHRSYRQIAKDLKVSYGFIASEIKKAKQQILNETT